MTYISQSQLQKVCTELPLERNINIEREYGPTRGAFRIKCVGLIISHLNDLCMQ